MCKLLTIVLLTSVLCAVVSSLARAFLAQRTHRFGQFLTFPLSVWNMAPLIHLIPSLFSLWELCHTCNYYFCGHLVPPPFLSDLRREAVFVQLTAPVSCTMTGTRQEHCRRCLRGVNAVLVLSRPWGYPLAAVQWSSEGLSFRNHLSGKGCVSGGLSGLDDSQARANHQAQPLSDVAGLAGTNK